MVNVYTQSDLLHSYGCIDSTLWWSYNAASDLASFRYLFASHAMYSIKFEYTLKVRTFIEILAQNGSFKMGALLGNFSLTGS